MTGGAWPDAPSAPVARVDEVHVWRVALDVGPRALAPLEATLAADERARADAFRRPEDRAHFVAARGATRAILASYAGTAPPALRFHAGPHGKPALAAGGVEFNVSHAGGLALVAVCAGRAVGVDVEAARPLPDARTIAERWFAPEERCVVAAGRDQEEVLRRFYACWTRKEAFAKALGFGLALPLDAFAVAAAPDEPPALVRAPALVGGADGARWTFLDLAPATGFAAAVVVAGDGPLVARCWTWRADA